MEINRAEDEVVILASRQLCNKVNLGSTDTHPSKAKGEGA